MSEFRIKTGETRTITKENQQMLVERFIMEDRSKIDFAPDVSSWELNATVAEFHGVSTIDAGRGGEKATISEDGADGVDLKLRLGIARLDTVVVDRSGGDGGDGRDGEQGSTGREASCSGAGAGDGGPGSPGTRAGNGGDQGEVLIEFWTVENDVFVSTSFGVAEEFVPGFNFIGEQGNPGLSGIGGPGGPGGRGKDNCGPWPYWRRGTGNAGQKGADGARGAIGSRSRAVIVPIPTP